MLESMGGRFKNIVFLEEEESREWVVEADNGVFITLLSKPKGKNHLRRVRFSKENFDKWHAQLWGVENYDKIVELYNVERTSREALFLITRSGSEEELQNCTREATQDSPVMPPRCRRNCKRLGFHRSVRCKRHRDGVGRGILSTGCTFIPWRHDI